MTKPLVMVFLAIALGAQAGSSAHYSLAPDTVDHGGLRGTSTHYTFDGSAMPGGAGESTTYTLRSGYAGQLSDVVALIEIGIELSAPQLTLNEGGALQLSAAVLYDDSSTAPLDASSVAWSVQSGPLSGISSSGLATAAAVYQDTAAVAQGTYQSFTDTLNLTVLNTLPDNFGSYAGDGIDDDWQVLYFNQPPNANAAPLADPDFDGQNNLFEFTAGVVPTDPQSRFLISAAKVPGQSLQKNIIFSPRLVDRSYTVQFSTTLLGGSWSTLTTVTTSDTGPQRTITDTSATGVRKFYRVQITKP